MNQVSPAPQVPSVAIGRSISFRPASLYDAAVDFGKANATKPNGGELNPSEVVCLALRRLFESEGFEPAGTGDERARLIEKAKSQIHDDTFAKELSALIKKSTKRRLVQV